MGNDFFLSKEDYEEPRCLLNMDKTDITPIPCSRVIEKLDEHLGRNDYSAAERHLTYWLEEANAGNDMRGKLTVLNEQIGLYRKLKKEPEGIRAISAALALANQLGLEKTVTFGTTLINAATGYRSFGKAEKALPLYQNAQAIYESALTPDDSRLGGLYNNMALTLTDLEAYQKAEELFGKALSIMEKQEHGEAEMAITYLNLADLVSAEFGLEAGEKRIESYLQRAEELLNTESLPKDGYYAFVCEKCAPVFGYYGHFLTEQELTQRAREIYERT